MQIQDAIDRFLLQLEADGRSPHTVGQYRRHTALFRAWLADVGHTAEISDIDHETVAAFLVSTTANTRPDGTKKRATSVNCLRTSLKVFLGYLHRAGYVGEDPGRLIRRAVCGTPPPKALSEKDAERLREHAVKPTQDAGAGRDRLLVHLLLTTGVRLTSALELDVGDVDLERGELSLRSTKGDQPATVFLGQAIRDHLRDFIGNRTSGALFVTTRGTRISRRHAQRRFEEMRKKLGIDRHTSPHSLRHTFATKLYQKTGDILLVKQALHHRSIASTLVYARAEDERLRKALG